MAKLDLVTVPSTDVEVEGFVAQRFQIDCGNRRTLFFVFKSYDIDEKTLQHLQARLAQTVSAEEGAKAVALVMDPEDSFEIHELTT